MQSPKFQNNRGIFSSQTISFHIKVNQDFISPSIAFPNAVIRESNANLSLRLLTSDTKYVVLLLLWKFQVNKNLKNIGRPQMRHGSYVTLIFRQGGIIDSRNLEYAFTCVCHFLQKNQHGQVKPGWWVALRIDHFKPCMSPFPSPPPLQPQLHVPTC